MSTLCSIRRDPQRIFYYPFLTKMKYSPLRETKVRETKVREKNSVRFANFSHTKIKC